MPHCPPSVAACPKGGGYTKRNVARCWTYETSILTDTPVPEQLPRSEYHEYFAPDFSLNVSAHKVMEDSNTKAVGAGKGCLFVVAGRTADMDIQHGL